MLDREDVLVLIADGATGPFPLDPVRLMKGAFLVHQRGRPEWQALFNFEAYAYGPFDRSVYIARDALLSKGLFHASHEGRYEAYSLTEPGQARAAEIEAEIGEDDANWLRSIGAYVTALSFASLLKQIYEAYPRFAAKSVARV